MKLKQACAIYGDYGLNVSAEEYTDEGTCLIRTSDVDDRGNVSLVDAKRISTELASKKLLRRGDLLFSRSGTIGRSALFNRTDKSSFAAYLVRFRPRPDLLSSHFAGYWAQSAHYWLQIRSETIETTIGNFNASKFSSLSLPEIDLPTQKRIAAFLDKETAHIDALIEKNERLISLCEEKRRSEMKEVFSQASNHGMTNFKRMFNITLGKMLQPEAQSTADVKLPYLRAANVLSGRVSHEDINTMWFSEREAQKFRVSSGDLLVLEGGDVGRSAIASKFENGLGFQNSIHRVRATRRGDVLCAHFWLQHLKAEGYFEQICSKATLAHFTLDKFRETPFPFMEQEEQVRVGNLLLKKTTAIDGLVKKTKKFIELLKEKRSALITAAVTGQLEIPE